MANEPYPVTNFELPLKLAFQKAVAGGVIEQLADFPTTISGEYTATGRGSQLEGLITAEDGSRTVIRLSSVQHDVPSLVASRARLLEPEKLFDLPPGMSWRPEPDDEPQVDRNVVRTTNAACFRFAEEQRDNGLLGLRPPQVGALHAVLGHWSVSDEPVTVVMPTGTGKTETMLSLLAQGGVERLLVIVPTDPLRAQTFRKFLTQGLLPRLGVLTEGFAFPIVGRLDHAINTAQEASEMFEACNVVVATVHALSGSSHEARARVVELCSHLFLDEAHHVAAPTWKAIKAEFASRRIVQFTATPYRRDSKRVDGRIIYSYPLRKAQAEGYFSPIQYRPVFEFDLASADRKIAETAIAQLREDLEAGFDHLLMARVDTIRRAEDVVEHYKELAPDLNPVLIHSQMGTRNKRNALTNLRARDSKVIVCVDMLGEGFDLPQLKVAAIHDVHKSLAITLQFTGRFTRAAGENLGQATMIANAGDVSMEHALRQLYAEDADWNQIIREIGDNAIGSRVKHSEFLATFPEAIGVPLENILPKMSTVVFKTTCEEWAPSAITDLVPNESLYVGPAWSDEHKVALYITRDFEAVPWGDIRDLQNLTWNLYLLYWDEESRLLYINSSNNDDHHVTLAKSVSGEDVERIHGEVVYRALHNISRLVLMNLGLLNHLGRATRHTMHNGSDVGEQWTPTQLAGKSKTNLFGRGYENGERVSIGCSRKGRLWSYQIAESIPDWIDWCKVIGAKLTDESITEEQVLRGVLRPVPVTERPNLVPLDVDWNVRTYLRSETSFFVRVGEATEPFYEAELRIINHENQGDIRFMVVVGESSVEYRAVFSSAGVTFIASGAEAFAVTARGQTTALSAVFQKEPPALLFEHDTSIEDNLLFVVHGDAIGPYDREKIQAWNWDGVDLRKESQRAEKRPDSIQRKVLETLNQDNTIEFVFDDDSSGEAADIVAVRREGAFLHIDFYHCKFAKDGTVGTRVEDLYQVCGQTQKSIRWRDKPENLFKRLRLREAKRLNNGKPSRIEKGDARLLFELLNSAHLLKPLFRMFIVQPGLSKAEATDEQLTLLGATELFLTETYSIPLEVIASE